MKQGVIIFILSSVCLASASLMVEELDTKPCTSVTTKYGNLRGSILTSRENRTYFAYRGIPYAKPPVRELRFKAPVPPDSWVGVLNATEDSPFCIQKNYLFHEHPEVEGKEDCLYLNVYTPKLQVKMGQNSNLLPVMVNIHFGGFLAGTGRSDYMGPEYFMDKDIVLVTFNYRLGVFGFLSTNDDEAPGNWAFKDQVAALKWVQENIHSFSGNNKNVTIFGESAGAGSVHHHMLSPSSAGLFHQAISQSGSTLSLWARPFNALQAQVAAAQAHLVNCSIENTKIMIACLRNIDASVLANSADYFKYFSSEPLAVYGPVTEKRTDLNPEPFITEDPLKTIQEGNLRKIPWILGVVRDEGILRAAPLLRNSKTREQLNANFNQYGPKILALALSVSENDTTKLWNNMTSYFIEAESVNISNHQEVQGFIDMFGDRAFKYGSYQSALLHAWKGHSKVWFYNFGYKGEYTYGNHFAGTNENFDFDWGISHSDDLLYLFPSPALFDDLKSPNDILMSKALIQMWTDFAIKGDPSPNNDVAVTKWDPLENLESRSTVTNSDLRYLDIVGSTSSDENNPITFKMETGFLKERMRFWESLPLGENINGLE